MADLATIYGPAARHSELHRNPVVVIPGLLGSRLVDEASGDIVWGAFGDGAADPETPEGARLLALPMATDEPLDRLVDAVRVHGALDRVEVNLLGFPIQLGAYAQILGALGVGNYRDRQLAEAGAVDYGDDHFTCFQFAYDWRRDNVENARRLAIFLHETRRFVQTQLEERYGTPDANVRFDIVAHSMGGLLTRYFLRYGDADLPSDGSTPEVTWAGHELVDRAVLIATPNAGSVKALYELVHGVHFSSLFPDYPPEVLGTMPAIYQLLPRVRHRRVSVDHEPDAVPDLFDPELWQAEGWGLLADDADPILAQLLPDIRDPAQRRLIARDHLSKALARAEHFTRALDQPAARPDTLALDLIVGDAVATEAELTLSRGEGSLWVTGWAPGDGTVTRASALLDERIGSSFAPRLRSPVDWSSVTFLFRDHLELTGDATFIDNLLYRLLEEPRAARP